MSPVKKVNENVIGNEDTNDNANPDQKSDEDSDGSDKEGTPSDEETDDANSETSLSGAQLVKAMLRRKRIERGLPVTPPWGDFPLKEGKRSPSPVLRHSHCLPQHA